MARKAHQFHHSASQKHLRGITYAHNGRGYVRYSVGLRTEPKKYKKSFNLVIALQSCFIGLLSCPSLQAQEGNPFIDQRMSDSTVYGLLAC